MTTIDPGQMWRAAEAAQRVEFIDPASGMPTLRDVIAMLTAALPHLIPAIREQVLSEARETVARQTDLTELMHFERPSDFRKGVLTCLAALDALARGASEPGHDRG